MGAFIATTGAAACRTGTGTIHVPAEQHIDLARLARSGPPKQAVDSILLLNPGLLLNQAIHAEISRVPWRRSASITHGIGGRSVWLAPIGPPRRREARQRNDESEG